MKKAFPTLEPLTQQAYRQLKDHLVDAHFAPGESLPSLRAMTRTYGFRRDTLWRAIKKLESENWLEASTSTCFRVNPSIAHSFLPRVSVAFVVCGDQSITQRIFQRVYDTLATHGPRMNIYPTLQLLFNQPNTKKLQLPKETDLILLSSDVLSHLPEIQATGLPVIGINTPLSLKLPYIISTDNFLGGQLACPPLLQSDPQQVMIITSGDQQPGPSEGIALRALGFRKAWIESGRNNQDILELVLPVCGWQGIRQAIYQFIVDHPKIQGIFAAAGGDVPICVMDILKQIGRSTPDDVSVIGFDGSLASRMHHPPITTISTPMEAYAIKALQLSRRLLQNDPQMPPPSPMRLEMKPDLTLGLTTPPGSPESSPAQGLLHTLSSLPDHPILTHKGDP